MNLGLGLFLSSRGGSQTPATILANIAHWYRADLGITLNVSAVSQWNDQVGTAHLVQATGAAQPTYNATDAAYNNQPTVQTAATGKQLLAAVLATPQPCSIWLVGETSTDDGVLFALGSSGTPTLYRFSGTGIAISRASAQINSAVTFAAKRAILATYNNASSYVGVSNFVSGGVSGSAGTGDGTQVSAFSYGNGTLSCVGKLAEVIIQAGTPTSGEKAAMAAYFLARYGITVT